MKHGIGKTKFALGQTVGTPGVLAEVSTEEIAAALSRHERGDWGDAPAADREENELSLVHGFRLMSVYRSRSGVVFWVITEADRSSTCVLLPSEY